PGFFVPLRLAFPSSSRGPHAPFNVEADHDLEAMDFRPEHRHVGKRRAAATKPVRTRANNFRAAEVYFQDRFQHASEGVAAGRTGDFRAHAPLARQGSGASSRGVFSKAHASGYDARRQGVEEDRGRSRNDETDSPCPGKGQSSKQAWDGPFSESARQG